MGLFHGADVVEDVVCGLYKMCTYRRDLHHTNLDFVRIHVSASIIEVHRAASYLASSGSLVWHDPRTLCMLVPGLLFK